VFATLLGGLPRPPVGEGATSAELVAAAIAAQSEAGLEPLVDGGLWGDDEPGTLVERWRATAALTDRAVKAVVTGPFSSGADARSLNTVLRELAAAGCPLVEVQMGSATSGCMCPSRSPVAMPIRRESRRCSRRRTRAWPSI
jgi:hypothetical protein